MSDNKKEDKTLAEFKKMVQKTGLTSKVLNSMKKIFSDKTIEKFVEQFQEDQKKEDLPKIRSVDFPKMKYEKDTSVDFPEMPKPTGPLKDAIPLKKGGMVKKKKNKLAGRLAMRGYGIARK